MKSSKTRKLPLLAMLAAVLISTAPAPASATVIADCGQKDNGTPYVVVACPAGAVSVSDDGIGFTDAATRTPTDFSWLDIWNVLKLFL